MLRWDDDVQGDPGVLALAIQVRYGFNIGPESSVSAYNHQGLGHPVILESQLSTN